jgi:hypothetical protein
MNTDYSTVPPVPKRPLTAYNLFSTLERNYILQENQKTNADEATGGKADAGLDPYLLRRPQRYRDIVLPSNWYMVGMNRKKRAEHKNHGLISFKGLSKTVSQRWQEADEEVVDYCKMIAAEQLESYRKAQDDFKKRYGEEAFNAQKKTYKKRRKSDSSDVKSIEAKSEDESEACWNDETNSESVANHSDGQRQAYEQAGFEESNVDHATNLEEDNDTMLSNINPPSAFGRTENQQVFQPANLFAINNFGVFANIPAMYNGLMLHQNYGVNGPSPPSAGASSHAGPSLSLQLPDAQNESKSDHELMHRRGSGTSVNSDFSLGEYIASGHIAVRAFDSDDEFSSAP